jgi:hypothetical protein
MYIEEERRKEEEITANMDVKSGRVPSATLISTLVSTKTTGGTEGILAGATGGGSGVEPGFKVRTPFHLISLSHTRRGCSRRQSAGG